ncbi:MULTISPECIES: GGDEF domain-containing protein [Marinobacter]|uniref:GGDEF domain-containing protein n=1 Tax=Marinobacter TaxID=2742 RepID=UPI001E39FD50|nr:MULTISPECIES: GGDEF domain-containing protein [Marinobacter]MDX5440070.1 GGDEF domain-containing protein [Alteromonadaceae bacterium]MCD1630789.1 GGDEF domain-containing protein [Marinobacter shengliensis]MDX5336683.1 GGDEF domain-containing protein [Marinobacter sp.]MDX5387836.1 GGDEF domain-containing protein [Marinobacter sp.]MDX5473135.1 GGDEF domain-containing protein [Marinobacter sp.]
MAFQNPEAGAFHWLVDMLESVEVGLVVLDLDFRVQAWNGFMEHHSGITGSQIQNKVLFDVFPDIPQAWLTRKVDAVAMLNTRAFTSWEQRPYLFKFRNTRPITGTEEYMFQNLTISPLTGTNGEVDKICLLIYDVTEFASSKRALERANEQLAKLSMTDRLTGLLNRGTWENLVDAEYERYRRYGQATTLVMFDIDHFKPVNDNYGHLAGDEVIRHTAQTTRNNIRQSDSAGRYGGEEFGIILPETDAENARLLCERIRESIEKSTVETSAGNITYTISMGIAQLTDEPENYMQWMQKADEALYAAKESGRNRVVVAE